MIAEAGDPRDIIAVTGLALEARIASRAGVRTVVAAGNARELAERLEREIARGAKGIISLGLAGGLADEVAPGQWIVARTILCRDARWSVDRDWTEALSKRLPGALIADLASDDAIVAEPQHKRALHRATGASAVDTESHVAAAVATTHGLPFAAFRVVADPAARALPAAAMRALRPDGRVNATAVLASVLRAPRQLPVLARTAADARVAMRALSQGCRLLGRGLAYPNFHELLLDLK